MSGSVGRRGFLAGASALFVGACSKVAETDTAQSLFSAAQGWHRKVHRSLAERKALAKEYPRSAISPSFRGNGSRTVDTDAYRASLAIHPHQDALHQALDRLEKKTSGRSL